MSFGNFLKLVDPELHKQYVHEKFLERNNALPTMPKVDVSRIQKPRYLIDSPLRTLKKISQLSSEHPAKKYITKRLIPTKFHYKLFYTSKFKEWVNTIIPNKFSIDGKDEPRLIIPLIDKDLRCFGVQGRSFRKDGIRYITIMFDENMPKIFGLDAVDLTKKVYVTEGPIDSMFLSNAIAMAGSDGINAIDDIAANYKNNIVFVYDNEPRNEDICRIMDKVIAKGYNIAFWPSYIEQKDINDMVIKGNLNADDIEDILDQNTYNGIKAKLFMSNWKKI